MRKLYFPISFLEFERSIARILRFHISWISFECQEFVNGASSGKRSSRCGEKQARVRAFAGVAVLAWKYFRIARAVMVPGDFFSLL